MLPVNWYSKPDQQVEQSCRIPLGLAGRQAESFDLEGDIPGTLDQDKGTAQCLLAQKWGKIPPKGRCKAVARVAVGNIADNGSRGSDSTLHPTGWYGPS